MKWSYFRRLKFLFFEFYINQGCVKCIKGVYPVLTVRGIYKKNLPLVLSFFATAATPPCSTDSGEPSTTNDTVAANTTDGPQSTVSSRDTPADTTDNQGLPAAGSDTTEGDPCNLVKGEMALIDFYVWNSWNSLTDLVF